MSETEAREYTVRIDGMDVPISVADGDPDRGQVPIPKPGSVGLIADNSYDDSIVDDGHNKHVRTTKSEKEARALEAVRHRVEDYYAYMRGEAPSLAEMGIVDDDNVLSGDDQARLARLVQAGLCARVVLAEAGVGSVEIPSKIEGDTEPTLGFLKELGDVDPHNLTRRQRRRTERLERDGSMARYLFVRKNTRLLARIVGKEMAKQGNDKHLKAELTGEGMVGLIIATDKFDPDLGYKFSTYATWWIKQQITDFINNKTKLIRMPAAMNKFYRRIAYAEKHLRQTYQDSSITEEMVLEQVNRLIPDESEHYTMDKLLDARRMRRETVSLDAPLSDDGSKTYEHTMHTDEVIDETVTRGVDNDAAWARAVDMVTHPVNKAILVDVYESGMDVTVGQGRAMRCTINSKLTYTLSMKYDMEPSEVEDAFNAALDEIRRVARFSGMSAEDVQL